MTRLHACPRGSARPLTYGEAERVSVSQIINLRQARKKKLRDAEAREAAERRRQFGRSKADKAKVQKDREREDTRLEGHRLPSQADANKSENET